MFVLAAARVGAPCVVCSRPRCPFTASTGRSAPSSRIRSFPFRPRSGWVAFLKTLSFSIASLRSAPLIATRAPTSPSARACIFACQGYLRAFAPGVLLPLPPAPSPRAGGGRAQGLTRCALATLRLAPSPALPSAFAAARYARGRNAPRAGMRASASGLRAQARLPRRASLRARHFCLPRVFAPLGYVCPAAI